MMTVVRCTSIVRSDLNSNKVLGEKDQAIDRKILISVCKNLFSKSKLNIEILKILFITFYIVSVVSTFYTHIPSFFLSPFHPNALAVEIKCMVLQPTNAFLETFLYFKKEERQTI